MMNNGKSSSSGQALDPSNEFDADLDTWINNYCDYTVLEEPVTNVSGASVDDMTINPNYPSQPLTKIVDADTNFGGGSSHVSQFENFRETMKSSSINSSGSSSGQILSAAIKTLSNHAAQSSHNQPLMQQITNTKGVQQPQTHKYINQSNSLFDDQLRQYHHQLPSNQPFPSTGPMVSTQMDHTQRVQLQLNPSQNQLKLQPVTVISGDLISVGGQQQGSNTQANFSASVGFKSPGEFPYLAVYREYLFKEIRKMRDIYYSELQIMHSNAKQRHTQATTTDDAMKFKNTITYLEKMMRFLSISTVDSVPKDHQKVCNYMNIIVNYMAYNIKDKLGGSSQHCEPVHQSPNRLTAQLPHPSQRTTNLETDMVNFNQYFTSRRPQTEQSRMPSSSISTSFPRQQINLGSKTNGVVIGSGSTTSWVSNAMATNLTSCPPNHQLPVVNQKFNLEKMKQSMHKTNEPTKPKIRAGISPLGSRLVSHYPQHQSSLPSSVNSDSQQTSVLSSKFDVNSVSSPQSIARSPILLSSSSSSPSGMSSLTAVEPQKHTKPIGTPFQEPQTSKDAIHQLTQVVKSISSKALSCSLTDISSIEKAADIIPDCIPTNLVGQYRDNNVNNGPRPKVRRELIVTSMSNDQTGPLEGDIYSTETPINKKPKIENKWALLEEIKDINGKLLETTIHAMLDPSEDNTTILGGHEGIIFKCLFRNVCFPDLLGPHGEISSEKMPEFGILLLVPFDYPASPTRILRSGQNVLKSEPWGKLYEEMLTRFDLSNRGVRGILCLGELAKNWDASARAVMTEFIRKLGGKNFSLMYGSWESCVNSSSGSN